jgi:hypothetical protein
MLVKKRGNQRIAKCGREKRIFDLIFHLVWHKEEEVKIMICPLLCIKPDNTMISIGQCIEAACAWWITDSSTGTGKCAICRMGEYAAKQ